MDDYPLTLSSGHVCLCDDDYVKAFSDQIDTVFGYGVGTKREHGMNFYKHAWDLGENGAGILCIGGQRGSIQVQVKGQGLMAAKSGWEWRLFKLLQRIPGAKLTRVDLASDDFHSDIDIEAYVQMYHAGMFVNRGQKPNIEQAGNWIDPTGKGRTLYIGCRTSGKLLRIYEKGLQIANGYHEMFPNWLRVELELKSEGRIIPFEVLIRPGQYLAGAYPALANMHKEQNCIETQKKTVKSTFERAIETTKEQFGRYIWTAIEILGADEAIRRFTEGKEQIPKRLNFDTFEQFQYPWLHTDPLNTVSLADIPI